MRNHIYNHKILKEGVAHNMLNFPLGVAWKIDEDNHLRKKTIKTCVFIAYF